METPSQPITSEESEATPRARRLAEIVQALSNAPTVRSELVADIQSQVDGGGYMSEERLDLAIYRLLRNILE